LTFAGANLRLDWSINFGSNWTTFSQARCCAGANPAPGKDLAAPRGQPGQGFLEALHCPAAIPYQELDRAAGCLHRDRLS